MRIKKDRNDQQWAMMDTMLKMNGNVDFSNGFTFGSGGSPKTNPFEVEIKGEKENLTWLLK